MDDLWLALAAVALIAAVVSYVLSNMFPEYRRDWTQAMGWILLICAGCLALFMADTMQASEIARNVQ